ncbi:uncharacterized protein LOC110856419 [Folsomia candida]|nr:uncharacterized protein LOC110856419 [Folsomia candida]XP_035702521.1 uncharacterized protein LOC110856419 [Folsomia candida]
MYIYFWKKCEDFKISDHISLNEESDPEKLSKILNSLTNKSFPAGKPLWEFISLPNYAHAEYGTSSAVAMRVHHTVGDTLGFMSVVRDLGEKDPASDKQVEKLLKAIRKKMNLNFWKKVSYLFQLIFITPAQVTYCWFNALSAQGIPRNSNQNPNCDSDETINASTLIDLTLLKRISKKTGVNVTSVVHAGVAGAVRRTVLDKGGDPKGDISVIYALPKLNHPGTLSNNAFGVPLVTPMSGEGRFQRLARISYELDQLFYTPLPIGMMIQFVTLGLVLGTLGQMKFMPTTCTYIHSNGAYFGETMKMFGTSLERAVFAPGLQRAGNPLLVVTASYHGKLGLQLVGDRKVFPDEESLMRVVNYVEDEFESMDG